MAKLLLSNKSSQLPARSVNPTNDEETEVQRSIFLLWSQSLRHSVHTKQWYISQRYRTIKDMYHKMRRLSLGAGFSGGSVEKNPSANAGKAVSISGLQKIPKETGVATHSNMFAWGKSHQAEKPGGLNSRVTGVRHD